MCYNKLFDVIIFEFVEFVFKIGDWIVGCCILDVNGYIGMYNNKYFYLQFDDFDWNCVNCWNWIKFEDCVVLKVLCSIDFFILQVYCCDMGGGIYMLIKDVLVLIMVNGWYWGCLWLLYKL